MKTAIVNGTILTPYERKEPSGVLVDQKEIVDFLPVTYLAPEVLTIDANGMFIVPGFIDLHIHGAMGYDTMDATQEAIHAISSFLAIHGVTSFLPTTVSASQQDTLAAIRNIAHAQQSPKGAEFLGIHCEGPYLDKKYCGAQSPKHLRYPDPDEYKAWFTDKVVKLITLAPELPRAGDLIQSGINEGIHFAAGHSDASFGSLIEACSLGLDQITHVFNGMAPLHHRIPGLLGAALVDERIYTQVIVDGIHVDPAIIKLLVKAKGKDRIILISDAIRAAGMPDGTYALGDQSITVNNGIAQTQTGGLAGSTLSLDAAVRNTLLFTGLDIQDVLPMATSVPAEAMGLHRKGQIAPGYDADILVIDKDMQVRLTMVSGRIIFSNLPGYMT